jgi:hypothetical protein
VLHLAAQAQDLAVVIGLVVGDADQDQALGRQVAVARIHPRDFDAQVGVVVPVVGRLDDRAGDQQVVVAVVKEGDVERIESGNGHLVACRAQEQAGKENKNKRRNEICRRGRVDRRTRNEAEQDGHEKGNNGERQPYGEGKGDKASQHDPRQKGEREPHQR